MVVKRCLKAGQMCTAFCVVNVVTEAKDVLMEFIDILKSISTWIAVSLAFKVDRIMKWLRFIADSGHG